MNQGNKESHGQCNISNIYTNLCIYVCVSERERDRGKCIDTDRQKGLTTVLRRNERKMFVINPSVKVQVAPH